jgi:hypothetical protein
MEKKRYGVERRNLSAYPSSDLGRIGHFVRTVSDVLDQANISSDMELLVDLESAVIHEICDIGTVLRRIERRIDKELATRT